MISIINGYDFKRNFDNSVYFPINSLASILNLQPYEIKEHFYFCVASDLHVRGDFQIEFIEHNELNIYLTSSMASHLIDSLKREGFDIDVPSSERFITKMLETERLVSEFFDKDDYYSDPIRKIGSSSVKDISKSITRNSED